MLTYLLTGTSGWVLVVLIGATTTLPYLVRRPRLLGVHVPGPRRGYLERLWPHYRIGYAIGVLAVLHAWIPMSAGLGGRVDQTGLYVATVALGAIAIQVSIGYRLREPRRRDRLRLRRMHVSLMAIILILVAGHVWLDGSLMSLLRLR